MTAGRKPNPAPVGQIVELNEDAVNQDRKAANELALITREGEAAAQALATQLGYDGSLAVGALEDEIRFYQRRTVEALLETGKRLLLLKQLTPHGEFAQRVELLGFSYPTAARFMHAAQKTAKSLKLRDLAGQVKSASAFLELVTHDDDVLENLAEMDAIDKMSASQLRAALREANEEADATKKVLADKNAKLDAERAKLRRIKTAPPDEALKRLTEEAQVIKNTAWAGLRGQLRPACEALHAHAQENGVDTTLLMANIVGEIQAELTEIRSQFGLPDLSNAASQALAGEVAQWAGNGTN